MREASLESLAIDNGFGKNNLLRDLNRFKKLERLYLKWIHIDRKLQFVKHSCSNLKEIIADDVTFENLTHFITFIGTAYPKLTRLHFYDCTPFESSGIYNISNLSALQHLVIKNGSILNCTMLRNFHSLPNLRSLELFCSELEGMDQIEQSFQLTQIRKLDVTVMVYECYLLRLIEIFPALTSLTIEAREKYITASVETKAVEKLPKECILNVHKLSNSFMAVSAPGLCNQSKLSKLITTLKKKTWN